MANLEVLSSFKPSIALEVKNITDTYIRKKQKNSNSCIKKNSRVQFIDFTESFTWQRYTSFCPFKLQIKN
uniref:Uncharacterized protein n=1 Tax=Rhizophora mucronata TaxID=61149 RepID=A0A2P2N4N1_RHIMU